MVGHTRKQRLLHKGNTVSDFGDYIRIERDHSLDTGLPEDASPRQAHTSESLFLVLGYAKECLLRLENHTNKFCTIP